MLLGNFDSRTDYGGLNKKLSCFFIGLLLGTCVLAQQTIITVATQCITDGKFTQAEQYLDSILKGNPVNEDALVMKGNVLLNYTWQNTSRNYFDLDRAESVFDTSATVDQSFFTPIIPVDTSKLIEGYWLKVLAKDSGRLDVQKGLCNLYSLSLRTADLKARLRMMGNVIVAKPDNAFIFAEYARNLKARGRFDEGMEIYQLIADMFPQMAGIRCDMASEYFYAGKAKDALRYLDSTFKKSDVDQTSFLNGAFTYSNMGYYDEALKILQRYSKEDSAVAGDFYKGLLQFARMDTGCYAQLSFFLKNASEQNYYNEVQLAQRILSFQKSGFGMSDYQALARDAGIPDYYKVLIHQRAMLQFKDSCEPFMNEGLFQCSYKNYPAAVQFLGDAANCGNDKNQTAKWVLAEAYALFKNGENEKALAKFNALTAENDLFIRQAAQYFSGKILTEKGNKKEATKPFEEIIMAAVNTKYRYLALNYRSSNK